MIWREGRDSAREGVATGTNSWVDHEIAGCEFDDVRLGRRFRSLLEQICEAVGESIPLACQDWANTKAAYRFLSNDRVNEEDILSGHFQATSERFAGSKSFIFVLHDTTEFSFQREKPDLIGVTYNVNSGRDKAGRLRSHTVCGILMHSSLAVTSEGLPLGLAAVKFWTRKKFKGTAALKKSVNLTRIPIEKKESIRWLENLTQSTATLGDPARCVHIGDRESDIYELFCTAQAIGTHFLVRTCVDRLAGNGDHTVADEMKRVKISGPHRIEVRDADGKPDVAILEIKYKRIRLLPPIGKQKHYPPLEATVIHAYEQGRPKNRKRIDLEAHHGPAGSIAQGCCREAAMVLPALENRAVPQDSQIRLQG